jgi:RNA polymerase sigma-70 factor (ECF subfamily)
MAASEFSSLVDAHYLSLYRFAFSLAHNPADASDLVQQTFLVWGTKGGTLRDPRKAKTWLFTTLYRQFIQLRRHEQRSTSLDDLPDGGELAAPEIEHLRSLDAGEAMAALQQVPESLRTPLVLYFLEDLSYRDIAEALDVPIGTVMSRLSRGKQRLRQAFWRHGETHPHVAPRSQSEPHD